MTFNNSILAGTVLARENIQSEGYTVGVSGWIIERDGDAEFNSIVVRGSVISRGSLYTVTIDNGEILFTFNGPPEELVLSLNPRQFAWSDNSSTTLQFLEYYPNIGVGFRDSGSNGVSYNQAKKIWVRNSDAFGTPEDWTQATLNAGWAHLGEPVKYKMFPDGTVRLRGGASRAAGTPPDGTVVFNLPAGYRPVHNSLYPCGYWGSNTVGRIFIGSGAGDVQTHGAPTNQVALDGIEFSTI